MIICMTGKDGRIGSFLSKGLSHLNLYPSGKIHKLEEGKHDNYDITDYTAVKMAMSRKIPDVFIHLAAMTDTKECEENKKKAWQVNVLGTRNIALACKMLEIRPYIIYFSTTAVFDCKEGGYDEYSTPCPKTHYGFTKYCGERELDYYTNSVILRGAFLPHRFNVEEADVNRLLNPIFYDDLLYILPEIMSKRPRGIIHLTTNKPKSFWELCKTAKQRVSMGSPYMLQTLTTTRWHTYDVG